MSRDPIKREVIVFFSIVITGLIVALFFCFVIYSRFEGSFNIVLDPDRYGQLGINLWKGYGLSYNPEDGPTIYRGPLYPGFIALVLLLSSGWYPGGIWVAQSLLFGFTCFCAYLIAKRCWDRKTALVTGFGCAFYPVLFWYAPRMWNESLLAFLVTLLIYGSVSFVEKSNMPKAVGIGILLGLLCLVKATFLPLIAILPLCFFILLPRVKRNVILIIAFVAVLLIAPWTLRNYLLLGRVVPIHTGAGFNMKVGNAFARDFLDSPFSYDEIWQKNINQIRSLAKGIISQKPLKDIQDEDVYMSSALADLRSNPGLLVRKILVAGSMFWCIGDNRSKTLVLLILRLPILVLAVFGIYKCVHNREIRLWPAIVVILVYWLSHLPFAPPSRLSMPIMPLVFSFAISYLLYWFRKMRLKTDGLS